ncbi:site-specific integrase [Streptomyces sp. NPDC003300]|uniref:tyrosine-type recombinase/integrase n=1 Tax=unclassified Streptomyces TaxID=2593676 RepID=UPI0033BE7032
MARRSANGEGTIYRRKDGRYEGAVYVQTSSGTRKRVRLYGVTRAEVHGKLTEAKAKNQQGILVADKKWLLGDYLDYWLAEVVKPNRRGTTYDLYESNVRLYLKPHLGHLSFSRLSVAVLQRFLNQHSTEGHSVRKVQTLRDILSSALTRAMREELITRNVARLVEVRPFQRAEIQPWTPSEVSRFLEVAKGHKWYPAFLLIALYGLRRGEAIGLRWGDIDLVRRELHIRQQVFRAGGEVQQGPVKTQAGRRDLPLVTVVAEALALHREEQSSISDADLIFTSSSGRPIEPYNFTRAFQFICARHKLRRIKLHHVRHTAATVLKNLGVPARDAQLILGHSHVSITQQIYQHDTMDSRRDALKSMEGAYFPAAVEGDGNGSRQLSRQTSKMTSLSDQFSEPTKKSPRLFSDFSWLGWRDSNPRMPVPKLESGLPHHPWQARITEVDAYWRVRRRTLIVGIVAVNLAVKT